MNVNMSLISLDEREDLIITMIRLVEQCELDDDWSRKKLIQNNQIILISSISSERRVNILLLHLSITYHSLLEVIMNLDNEYCTNENDAIIIHFWRFSCAHDAVMSYAHREMIVKHLVFHQASNIHPSGILRHGTTFLVGSRDSRYHFY